ncbi:MAG: hypothetical protein HQL52_08205 [Magnetococcales bacterium]|nr:hypothetical protein [Magnetococcales bacterium]
MVRYLWISLLAALLLTGPTPQAQAEPSISPFIKELEKLEGDPDKQALFKRISSPKSQDEYTQTLDWLKKRVFEGAESRYALIYSHLLFQHPKLQDTAGFMWIYGRLLMRTDGARCQNKTAAASHIKNTEPQFEKINKFFINLPLETKTAVMKAALNMEHMFKKRPANAWICSGGKKSLQGKDKTTQAKLIDFDTWQKRRDKIRQSIRKAYLDGDQPEANPYK